MGKTLVFTLIIFGIIYIVLLMKGNGKVNQDSSDKTEPEVMPKKSENQKKEYLKIYKSEVPNTKVSLIKKVEVSQFLEFVRDEAEKKYLNDIKFVYMWDFGVKATRHLSKSDKIWILTGDKLFETELQFIIKDAEGKIGDTIGWARQFNGPWKNVAILKKCKKHNSTPEWIIPYMKGEKRNLISNFYKIT